MKRGSSYWLPVLLAILFGCLEPYNPPVSAINTHYLVIDAFVNSTDGNATVKLSRTLPLYSKETQPYETNASVIIEDQTGTNFLLHEKGNGLYTQENIAIDLQKKYRLHIRTLDKEEFFSEFITLKKSPPIDSVYWIAAPDGLRINIDTHDPSGNSRYYKWNYVETWEYNSLGSLFRIENGAVILRAASEYVGKCWKSSASTDILVGSTERLQEDIVSHSILNFIEKGSWKISIKYSIKVQQQAITEEAYNYWIQLQKTTESLGGLFDPMPTQVTGNFYNATNPTEPVLGFFSGGSVEEQRIFVDYLRIPQDLRAYYRMYCPIDSILAGNIKQYTSATLLISSYGTPFVIGYTTSTNDCIDCRLRGGSLTKPDFWK